MNQKHTFQNMFPFSSEKFFQEIRNAFVVKKNIQKDVGSFLAMQNWINLLQTQYQNLCFCSVVLIFLLFSTS